MDKKALMTVKEMSEYLGVCVKSCRKLLADPNNGFTVRIGRNVYAHRGQLDKWLLRKIER